MKHSYLRCLLSLCVLLAAFSFCMTAVQAAEEAVCNPENYTYTITDGTASITKYTGSDPAVRIPDELEGCPVTVIGSTAFKGNTTLESVILPAGLTEIESGTTDSGAFYRCTALKTVDFSACTQLTEIGMSTFRGCSSLTEAELPEGLIKLGAYAFLSCTAMERVVLPDSLQTIGTNAFSSCSALSQINYPRSLSTSSNNSIFDKCTSLTSIVIPEGVTAIPKNLFAGAPALATVSLPEGLLEIGASAFSGCEALAEIEFPASLSLIGGKAFKDCTSLTGLVFPAGLTEIESGDTNSGTFSGCTNLQTIDFSACTKLTEIGMCAFRNCPSLTEVELPEGLIKLGAQSFVSCKALERVALPDSLQTIGVAAFQNCSALSQINYPRSLNSVSNSSAFEKCTSLTSIVVPEGATKIPQYCFYKAAALRSVTLPESLTSIGDYAFSGCENIEELYLSKNVTLTDKAFNNAVIGKIVLETEDSPAALSLIDMGRPYVAGRQGIEDAADRYLDRTVSGYFSGASTIPASGVMPVTIRYEFKEDAQSRISSPRLTIKLPKGENVSADYPFTVNGETVQYTETSTGIVRATLPAKSGTVSFYIAPKNTSYLMSYATITYKLDGKEQTETIGILDLGTQAFTLDVPQITNEAAITVNGAARPLAEVTLRMNGETAATVTASRTGNYTASLTLPGTEERSLYEVEAQTVDSEGAAQSISGFGMFLSTAPKVTEFKLYSAGKWYDVLKLASKNPVITVNGTAFTFRVRFQDSSRVEKVRIVSTKANGEKYLNLPYDEKTDSFTAKGFGVSLPGIISLQYIETGSDVFKDADVTVSAITNTANAAGWDAKYEDSSKDVKLDNFVEYKLDVEPDLTRNDLVTELIDGKTYTVTPKPFAAEHKDGGFYTQEMYFQQDDGRSAMLRFGVGMYDLPVEEVSEEVEKNLAIQEVCNKTAYMLEALTSDDPQTSEDAIYTAMTDFLQSAMDRIVIDPEAPDPEKAHLKVEIMETLEMLRTEEELYNIAIDAISYSKRVGNEAIELADDPAMLMSDLYEETLDDCMDAMKKVAKKSRNTAMKNAMERLTKKGLFGDSLMERIAKMYEEEYSDYKTHPQKLKAHYNRQLVDPSGYVYEGAASNRLEGVTATVYYRQELEETGETLWDAAEYDQENPLSTDRNGFYAWDVPIGYWQVRYEKDGYEPAASEWLPVPPPQLDVNIGLIAKAAPKVTLIKAHPNAVEAVFSQYMDASTVNAENASVSCQGTPVTGTWEAVNAEADPQNAEKTLATIFRFTPSKELTESVTCTLRGAVNYAGKSIADVTKTVPVEPAVESVKVPETVNTACHAKTAVTLQVSPASAAAGKKLTIVNPDPDLLTADRSVTFGADGTATFYVTAELPCETLLRYAIEDTTCTGTILVLADLGKVPEEEVLEPSLRLWKKDGQLHYEVKLPKGVDAALCIASYESSGRMTGLQIIKDAAGTAALPADSALQYKAFLIDPKSFVPLAPKAEL